VLGKVHPTTLCCGAAVIGSHILVKLASPHPTVVALAASLG